jgi:hypothetical protein
LGTYAAQIQNYIKGGGGLVSGGQTWYWASQGGAVDRHPSNILMLPMGIYATDWTAQADYTMHATVPPLQLGNADLALNCSEASFKGDMSSPYFLEGGNDKSAALDTLVAAGRMLPMDSQFWGKLQKVGWRCNGLAAPLRPDPPGSLRAQAHADANAPAPLPLSELLRAQFVSSAPSATTGIDPAKPVPRASLDGLAVSPPPSPYHQTLRLG